MIKENCKQFILKSSNVRLNSLFSSYTVDDVYIDDVYMIDKWVNPNFKIGDEVQTTNLFKGKVVNKNPYARKKIKGIIEGITINSNFGTIILIRCKDNNLRSVNAGWLEYSKDDTVLDIL